MLNGLVLFNNLFRAERITPQRLYGFGVVVLQALILGNDKGEFADIINLLTDTLATLKAEISDIDSTLNDQKTETKTVNAFIATFQAFMSDNEPFIAAQLGGRDSAGYKAFYPFGQLEYARATKTTMPMLTSRVSKAATKYADQLDPKLAEQMVAFDPTYEKQYGSQQSQIHTVKQERNQRDAAVLQTQLALTQAVHTVGMQYPGDVATCSAFFPFKMLYPQSKKVTNTLTGTLEMNAALNLLNRVLTNSVTITAKNTGDAAAFALWVASTASADMPADAYVVNAAATPVVIKAASLGNLQQNTFIMIKNLSNTNSCDYEVAFTGLKKPIDNTVENTDMIVVTA